MNNNLFRQFAFWILFFGVFFGTNIYSQTGTVSVDFKNSSPQKIIDNLKSRTPYQFIYQKNLDLTVPLITLKKDNVSIDEILVDLQNMTNLNFRRNENNIAVNSKDASKKKKKGKITGKVVDVNGLSLPGVNVMVAELSLGTQSDIDGNYVLELEPGEYTIEISAISFQTQKITGVKVLEGSETPLVVSLKEDAESLKEVVIVQDYKKATASVQGLLLQQKKAAQFSDGISAEQIARTPDRDVASSLKRITGVTTVGDKYVVVRSMGERWNQAVMDGIALPSTDAYQQNFSFDIIPTSIVESIVVSKSATPDMYANFAGGYVEVKTMDIPKENFTNFSISTSYNSRSTFKERLTRQEGDHDYWGFDDGRRDYPTGLVALELPKTEAESGLFLQQSKQFTEDNFSTYKTYGAPGTTLQFGIGRTYQLKDNNKWGFVGSLIFKNTQEKLDIEHTERGLYKSNSEFTEEKQGAPYSTFKQYGFKNSGASYNYNSTLGGMFNASIQLDNHKITTRNTVMHIYNNQLTQITGWDIAQPTSDILDGSNLATTSESDYPVYTTFIQNKIEGNHKFDKLEINWYGAYGNVTKDTKDATFVDIRRDKVGDDVVQYYDVYNPGNSFRRSNFSNDEVDYNAAINFKYSFDFSDSFTNDIKAGYFGTYKKATNQQESAKLVTVGQTAERAKIYEPLSKFLDGSNYYYGGFGWQDFGIYGNRYVGDVKIHSPFLMLDDKLGSYVRFVWGVRAESYIYTQIESQSEVPNDFAKVQGDDKVWQFLPSASLIISPTNKMNVRLGYNKSVLRPQFAERLTIPYFDPIRSAKVYNYTSGLVSSVANNYDLKLEWFPSGGELLSFGVYHKNIDNPIEAVGFLNASGARDIYNTNSDNAKLWGFELEFYKNLSFLGEGDILKNLFVYGNASVNDTKVTSYVRLDGTGGTYEANRPLYGQSPYTYNLGLDYVGERLGFSLRHNAVGDQYILVGFEYFAEEIRKPYAVTDAQVSYKFFKEKNLELKCSMKNLFDAGIETYNNANSYSKIEDISGVVNPRERFGLGAGATNKFDQDIDKEVFKAKNGRTISLSINYSF
ncbi:TonB-dependent receptor [Flavobacterium sp. ANB]|uniref:TonB-dependent receptor n=1 Tax=unclassified Flavobacterium TaxID=196869 RepID=UPI0012B8AEED|nr:MULTISPECIES: TonB-dependent receptor [unclassified Flavobacterium]MBF4516882.1 TonB-dependent receptor [Flavobacterium sp. ANB]MTD69222.1 TonB-dependent receptor plug domain-containing protein [Flavobacterium sp. LC2016-13]